MAIAAMHPNLSDCCDLTEGPKPLLRCQPNLLQHLQQSADNVRRQCMCHGLACSLGCIYLPRISKMPVGPIDAHHIAHLRSLVHAALRICQCYGHRSCILRLDICLQIRLPVIPPLAICRRRFFFPVVAAAFQRDLDVSSALRGYGRPQVHGGDNALMPVWYEHLPVLSTL
jgi:hypothetical protein